MRAATPTLSLAAVALAVAANVSATDRGRRERLLEPPPEVGQSYERVYPNYPDPCLHYPCYPYRPAPPAVGQEPYPSLHGPGVEAAGADQIGHLIVIVEPVSAEVRLDGVRLQRQPDLSYVATVLAGKHRLEVRARGYARFLQTFDLEAGRGLMLPVRLVPAGDDRTNPNGG